MALLHGAMGNLANAFAPEEVTIKWILNEIVGTLVAVNKYAIAANCLNRITEPHLQHIAFYLQIIY